MDIVGAKMKTKEEKKSSSTKAGKKKLRFYLGQVVDGKGEQKNHDAVE